jgi:hypothetical protein
MRAMLMHTNIEMDQRAFIMKLLSLENASVGFIYRASLKKGKQKERKLIHRCIVIHGNF